MCLYLSFFMLSSCSQCAYIALIWCDEIVNESHRFFIHNHFSEIRDLIMRREDLKYIELDIIKSRLFVINSKITRLLNHWLNFFFFFLDLALFFFISQNIFTITRLNVDLFDFIVGDKMLNAIKKSLSLFTIAKRATKCKYLKMRSIMTNCLIWNETR